MSDNKVTLDQLDNSVVEAMTKSVGNVNMLNTENKTIVGAISEIVGKKEIANAIGEPLAETDKFTEMSSEINGLLSTFKTNMMNAGVVVESGDKFKTLIDKIQGLTEGEGNKGIRFVSGNTTDVVFKTHTHTYTNSEGEEVTNSNKMFDIEIELDFDPSIILVASKFTLTTLGLPTDMQSITVYDKLEKNKISFGEYSNENTYNFANSYILPPLVEENKYYLPIAFPGLATVQLSNITVNQCTWYAIGVGEEDTTLRDSLASILQEEGVDVTEEDDMASLITKTDNEFAENTNKLYNLMLDSGYEVNSGMNMDSLLEILELSGIGVSDIKQIACGGSHTFVLKTDGCVWSCGNSANGQLGLGINEYNSRKTIFTQVTTNINNDVKQIACGYGYTFILKIDGSIWACGHNYNGQLGIGNTTEKTTFTKVTKNISNDVKQIVCGRSHTFILKNDGSVWCCGYNYNGQLGLGNTTDVTTFTKVTTNINNDVKQIVCGRSHTFILKNDGSIWACGDNSSGQLGLGDDTKRTTFTQVTENISNDVKQIICGEDHIFILKNDGSVWSCGENVYGQLGIGDDTTDRKTFTQVTTNISNDVKQIACGGNHTFILKNDGSVWSCGYNNKGQLGLGTSGTRIPFTQVTENINNDVKEIVCGHEHTFILKNDGSVWSCGDNSTGELGLGDTISTIDSATYRFNNVPRGIY